MPEDRELIVKVINGEYKIVQELIRCKECKNWIRESEKGRNNFCIMFCGETPENYFCRCGARKT